MESAFAAGTLLEEYVYFAKLEEIFSIDDDNTKLDDTPSELDKGTSILEELSKIS